MCLTAEDTRRQSILVCRLYQTVKIYTKIRFLLVFNRSGNKTISCTNLSWTACDESPSIHSLQQSPFIQSWKKSRSLHLLLRSHCGTIARLQEMRPEANSWVTVHTAERTDRKWQSTAFYVVNAILTLLQVASHWAAAAGGLAGKINLWILWGKTCEFAVAASIHATCLSSDQWAMRLNFDRPVLKTSAFFYVYDMN